VVLNLFGGRLQIGRLLSWRVLMGNVLGVCPKPMPDNTANSASLFSEAIFGSTARALTFWRSHIHAAFPPRAKVREWVEIVLSVGSAQAAVHAMGFLSGIWIVRCLSRSEYAIYTLTYAVLGMLNVLADGGISSGAMAEGGKVWNDRRRLGQVVNTALAMRRSLTYVSLGVTAPFGLYLLHRQGASWLFASEVLLVVLVSFWLNFGASILALAPALHQRLADSQKISVIQNAGRLSGLVIMLRWIPSSLVALIVNGACQAWAFVRMRRLSEELIDSNAPESAEIRRNIWAVVRRVLPGAVYFCLYGQVGIFIISFLGSSVKVAQIGALSRFGQVFNAVLVLVSTICVPRFARLPSSRRLLLARYFQVSLGLAIFGAVSVAFVGAFPTRVLWILGRQYSDLGPELLLLVGGLAISMLAQLTYSFGCCRGYVIPPSISITLELGWQVILILSLDLHSVRGVILMGLLMALFQYAIQATNLVLQIRKCETFGVGAAM
jgi:nitrate reductase NapE component